jgi:hypothetical protein
VDQQGEFLVVQVVSGVAAVVADRGLARAGALGEPDLLGQRARRAVAAEPEQRDVGGAGGPEVVAEAPDDLCSGRLLVAERPEGEVGGVDPVAEHPFRQLDVVHAALEVQVRQPIRVDPDQQGVDLGHSRASPVLDRLPELATIQAVRTPRGRGGWREGPASTSREIALACQHR